MARWLLAALALAGCAEESTTGIDTARGRMKPLVDAACEWMFGCCSDGELTWQVGDFTVDDQDCSDRLLDAIATGSPLALQQNDLSDDPAQGLLVLALSINEGRVDVDGGAVDACAQRTRDRACNEPVVVVPGERCTPDDAPAPASEDPCDPMKMFAGRQGVGEECLADFECSAGLRCVDFGIAGVCALRAAEGENCFSDNECADGLICDYAEGLCAPGALQGEACAFLDPAAPNPGTESVRCADGLSCDPATLQCVGGYCTPGAPCFDLVAHLDCPEGTLCVDDAVGAPTCRPPAPLGAPCTDDDGCVSMFCDPAVGACAERLPDGAPCGIAEQCASGFCDFNVGGACAPSVANGQPCDSFDDEQCADGYCDTSGAMPICTAYSAEGGPCPTGLECDFEDALVCVDMTCRRPPFPDGVSCGGGAQCESNVCFAGECVAGTPIGAACTTDGLQMPCMLGAFCETPDPTAVDGACAALRGPGEACERTEQCWGECAVRFGRYMCDATPATLLDELWCDGA